MSSYDTIAGLYDAWSTGVVEDISFYVDEALASGGPVVELGVGTGRIAIPTAGAGVHVIGVDSSAGMLEVCAEQARLAGVADRLDLRLGDLRRPPALTANCCRAGGSHLIVLVVQVHRSDVAGGHALPRTS